MEKSLQEFQNDIIEEFSMFSEWLDKYEYLIDLGKELQSYPEEGKTDDKLIKGCQSRVWLDYNVKDGRIFFTADSDAIITKGIISLLISVYSGRTPEEIANDDFSFINKIGLKENLSPTRANGLVSMIAKIREITTLLVRSEEAQEESKEVQKESKEESEVLTAEDVKALAPIYSDVILSLRQVYDPEIPVNVYDLGLIYEININKKRHCNIKMTFTSPTCPMAGQVIMEVQEAVESVPGIESAKIDLVFEPVWDQSMLSDEARVELGLEEF